MRAFHKNPEGEVLMPDKLDLEVPNGSMILSRRNANLIKPCFDLLLAGRRATIKGKEIGEGLVRFIRDLKADTVRELRVNVEKHRAKKMESFSDSTKASSMELMNDTCDCVLRFAEDAVTVEDVVLRIENIFSDTDDKNAITLSSAHKSKGLEADCVTIIDAPRIRMSSDRMTDDEHKQESNLEFVAITRAKSKLILVQS
jgi:superfamily I DNA/RNA helicase